MSQPVGGDWLVGLRWRCVFVQRDDFQLFTFLGGCYRPYLSIFHLESEEVFEASGVSLKLGNGRAFAWCIVIDLINKIQQACSDV